MCLAPRLGRSLALPNKANLQRNYMNPRPLLWLLLMGMCWSADPAWGRGQGPAKPGQGRAYVTIPFDGNLEELLRRRFSKTNLDDLFKKLNIDPGKINIDRKLLENIQKKDAQDLLNKIPPKYKKALTKDEIKKIENELKKFEMPAQPKVGKSFPIPPQQKPVTPPAENLEDRLGRWARDLMKNAEHSTLGDMLQDSSAWQEGIKDFERFLTNPETGFDLKGLDKLNLPFPKDLNIDLGQGWAKIQNLSLPGLPSMKVPLPDLGISNPFPALGLPGLPSGSLVGGQAAMWALVVLGLVLVLWQVFRRAVRPGGQAPRGRQLGPRPVDPTPVSNPADLIATRDNLLLLCLGLPARTWNHRAIGERLAADKNYGNPSLTRRAALELASLYEWALYAPEQDPPSHQDLARPRRHFCFLAGVAAP